MNTANARRTGSDTAVRSLGILSGALALGGGLLAWQHAVAGLFGTALDTRATLLAEAAAAFALGVWRPALTGRAIGLRSLAAAALTALVAWAPDRPGPALGWVGASLDAGVLVATIARLVVAGCLIVPAAFAAGSALAGAAIRLSRDELAIGAAGVVWGATATRWILPGVAVSAALPGTIAAGLGLVAGVGWMLRWRESADGPETGDVPADRPHGRPGVALLGASVACMLLGFSYLGSRVLVPAFGNDLPGVPVGSTWLVMGVAIGATVGLPLARLLGPVRASVALPLAVAAVAAGALLSTARYDDLPSRFVAAAGHAESYTDVLKSARDLALPRVGPLGALLGLAIALLTGSAPGAGAASRSWVTRTGSGVVIGGAVGAIVTPAVVAPLGLGGAFITVAGLGVGAAALAMLGTPVAAVARGVVSLVALGVLVFAATHLPVPDRSALLVEADLRSGSSLQLHQRSWTWLDREDADRAAAILRRGYARRLLVNGRFEMAGETTSKSHGILAHLPLAVHGPADRVLVVGAGTGWTIGAVLAQPVEHVDCLERSQVLVDAARAFSTGAERALSNDRVHMHIGDPFDLLSRAAPYAVILLEPSGVWTERSAEVCTREFLTLARGRLSPSGILAQWIPNQSLTRTGFLVLLATYCDVFPQVEVWAGQDGDVILLASREAGRHDFGRLRATYDNVVARRAIEASWIGTPATLLSQFLLDGAASRHLTKDQPVHTLRNRELSRGEAARRISEPTVNPVPGLVRLRREVLSVFDHLPPGDELRKAVGRAIHARDLEREAVDLEAKQRSLDAASVYRQALDSNPGDRSVRRAFATLRSEMGIRFALENKLMAAHGYLREAVEIDSTYASGFANLGRLLAQLESYDYAISVLRQATLLEPEDDLFPTELGRVWKKRGFFDKALPCYERAVQLNPLNVEAAVGYMDCKLAMQGQAADLKAALAFYEKYQELEPDNEELLNRILRFRDAVREPEGPSSDSPDGSSGPEAGD